MARHFAQKPRAAATRGTLLWIHRRLSLAVAALWLVQAATGVLVVFHWEIEDAIVAAPHRPTDLDAIGRRLDQLAPPGSGRQVEWVWTTAGAADRYDVSITTGAVGASETVRIAGDGTVLRRGGERPRVIGTLIDIHHNLLAGDFGGWVIGISGTLLLSNFALGVGAAWPRRGQWRALKPVRRGPAVARLASWHRALGLWVALPAVALVGAGTMLAFEAGTARLVGAQAVEIKPPTDRPQEFVPFADAVRAAQAHLPGGLTAVDMPTLDSAAYRIRLLAPDDIRRAYGTSVVYVGASDGRILASFPARTAAAPRAFMDGLYAAHTGELGGLAGRVAVLLIGLWLASMIVIGVRLWLRRGKAARPTPARQT